jgi:2',3'-cyclic-nucleotide 2'-phosphodiesterase/3'-nucleotidase
MVVSYHGGFEVDLESKEEIERKEKGENQAYRMCTEIDGIDVLLTGHQHRKLADQINGITVLQPGYSGACIAEAIIEVAIVNKEFQIVDKHGQYIEASQFDVDAAIVKLVETYERGTQLWLDQVIGYVEGDMKIHDAFQARVREHPLIELINRVQMAAAGVDISSTALFHNGSPGLPQRVTMRDIVANYIYPNSLMVIEITGEEMKEALERSASYFTLNIHGEVEVSPQFSYPKPQHYNYDMWEGISYTIDLLRPVGNRVIDLMYKEAAINSQQLYQVVMNNYRAGGGGDYLMFKGKKVIKEIQTDMSELLAQYFARYGTIRAEVNENWKVIHPANSFNSMN